MARQPQEQTVEESEREQERGGGGRGINQVTLVGRLARDPDLRTTEGGVARAWFVLAVPRPFVARDGDRDADFISIVAWRQLAAVVGEHLSKGRLIGVNGRLQVNLLEDGNGGRRSSAEVVADQIVFLDPPRRDRSAGKSNSTRVSAEARGREQRSGTRPDRIRVPLHAPPARRTAAPACDVTVTARL